MKLFGKNAQPAGIRFGRFTILCAFLFAIAGCAPDSDDGDVANTVDLPVDFNLKFYCEDVGLNTETCVLEDPKNPYRDTPFTTGEPGDPDDPGSDFNTAKFNLSDDAPSAKARFYVWATAQAIAPTGENQFYTAVALHELFTETVTAAPPGNALYRDQAIRAYRSLLDNFFDSSTFFPADFVPDPGIAYPVPLAPQTAFSLAITPAGFAPLFFTDPLSNEFAAREAMGQWGYTWVGMIVRPPPNPDIPGPVFLN